MRTNRQGRAIFLWWVAACAVGGFLAALDPTIAFLGFQVLFGGLLGAAQALVLRRHMPGVGPSWVAASFLGWVAGSLAQVFFPSEARFPGAGLLVESLPWAFLGTAQALALFWAARRPRPAALLAGLWALAGAVGGSLTEVAVLLTLDPFYGALRGTLGEYGINAVQVAVLVATLYAAPTGSVLVRVFRRAEAGGRVA